MIYFIRNEKRNIKIGSAVNPLTRIKELATSADEELELIGIKTGGIVEERLLHKRFKKYHIRREWFSPGNELMEYINSETDKPEEKIDLFKIIDKLTKRIERLESYLPMKKNIEFDNKIGDFCLFIR